MTDTLNGRRPQRSDDPTADDLTIDDVLEGLVAACTEAGAPEDVMRGLQNAVHWAQTDPEEEQEPRAEDQALNAAAAPLTRERPKPPPVTNVRDLQLFRPKDPRIDLLEPPAEWFDDPKVACATPLTVTADGQVYGHGWLWGTCHIGISGQCLRPPRSQTNYAHFSTGAVNAAGGKAARTGPITMGTGHADLSLGPRPAAAHYDDTGWAAGDVAVYEDDFGGVVAGAIRPGTTREQVRALTASALSGDWRRIAGNLELVALLAVNVPGFPVPRTVAASGGKGARTEEFVLLAAGIFEPIANIDEQGEVQALVAAGMVSPQEARIAELERITDRLAPLLGRLEDEAIERLTAAAPKGVRQQREAEDARIAELEDALVASSTRLEGDRRFPASSYAYAPKGQGPSSWNLRVADEAGRPDAEAVTAALEGLEAFAPDDPARRVVLSAWRQTHAGDPVPAGLVPALRAEAQELLALADAAEGVPATQ